MIVTYNYVYILLIYLTCSLLVFTFLTYTYKHCLKVEYIFLGVAFIIGLISFIGPKPGLHDETSHFARAYYISSGDLWGNKSILVPEDTTYIYGRVCVNKDTSTNLVPATVNPATVYPPTTYFPQVVGILVAKILHLNTYFMVYFARFGQLLFYLAMMFFAIRISPSNKTILLTVGLFPQVIKHASYPLGGDSTIISLTFLLCAFILYANSNLEYKISKNEKILLVIGSIFLSLLKISYLPLLGFLFLIPARCFNSTKEKHILIFSTLAGAALLNLVWLLHSFSFLSKGASNGNASSKEQLAFILSNPIEYFIIFLRTIKIFMYDWVHFGVLGFKLFGYLYPFQTQLMFASIFVMIIPYKKPSSWIFTPIQWLWIGLVILATVGLIATSLYLQWTALRYFAIDGIQGRYFLPMYFFALCFLRRIVPLVKFNGLEKYAFMTIVILDLSSILAILLQ